MKKIYVLTVALWIGCSNITFAQTGNNDNKHITVTNKNGKQEDIDIPEGMNVDLDSLIQQYNIKTYLKPDTTCHSTDVNPTFSQDVYIDRLKKLPTIIEMPYNDVVQKFIDRYSGDLRHSVSYMLGASNFYMPIFEQALETYDLPLELKYLPVIESALNPRAVSRVGATGLWQFMINTAKRYGLEVNSLVDERCDPVKASYAAAHYLSDLYKIFDDWNLVIAAYNCGIDKVNKAIHRTKGSADYWNIYPNLPKETQGYVPAFIAANYIMNYYCDHNICPMLTELPVRTDTVVVNQNIHFEQIAGVLGINIDELRDLNPQYRTDMIDGYSEPSSIRLPSNLIGSFIDKEDSIVKYKADELLVKRDVVNVNEETVSSSHHHHYRSAASNSSSRKSSRYSRSRRSKSNHSNKKKTSKNVTIKDGDTLSEIAERNHTTVKKLKKLNNINGNTIHKGKKIKIK